MSDPDTRITKEMTLLDILSHNEGLESVFRRYDDLAGECICCNCLFESLEKICLKYNIDLEKLMNELN